MTSTLASSPHLRVTQAFIDANPIDIDVSRPTIVADGTGGWRKSGATPIGTQRVRKVGLAGNPRELTTADGHLAISNSSVIALPDADIKPGDTFLVGDDTWEVLTTNLDPPWRLRAEVYRRA